MNRFKRTQGEQQQTEGSAEEAHSDVIVGLDIGTTKVCAIVAARKRDSNGMTILGIGESPSEGLNRGVVVNIEKTVRSIQQAVQQAEQQSGVRIEDVIVGIAGDHIQSFPTMGIVGISNPEKEITKADVERLLDETRKIALPSDRKILHIIPQDFIIDGQDGITDPVGMSGIRMEANVHVVTGLVTAAQNIYRCVERAGMKVSNLVLQPLASSYAVLDDEEKEIGVALIDIGGGTTDIAVFEGGIIRHTALFGIAGRQITDDVRRGLGIIAAQAERVKQEYGHALQSSIMRDEVFMIPGVGGRKPMEVTKSLLCDIIQPRMEELLEFALAEIRRSGYSQNLSAGIVLTGGGALLRGIDELAYQITGMPVKIGIPSGFGDGGLAPEIENPRYATGVGLIRYAMKHSEQTVVPEADAEAPTDEQQSQDKNSILGRMKSFFQEL